MTLNARQGEFKVLLHPLDQKGHDAGRGGSITLVEPQIWGYTCRDASPRKSRLYLIVSSTSLSVLLWKPL